MNSLLEIFCDVDDFCRCLCGLIAYCRCSTKPSLGLDTFMSSHLNRIHVDYINSFFPSLLKIFPHQHQNRLRYGLPRSRVRYSRDFLRHLHRLGGKMLSALGVDVEGFQRRPAGQHQQLVGIDAPVICQQDAYRHVGTITGADASDGLVQSTILCPISRK
jgi:hypothetical protein